MIKWPATILSILFKLEHMDNIVLINLNMEGDTHAFQNLISCIVRHVVSKCDCTCGRCSLDPCKGPELISIRKPCNQLY